MAVSFIFSSIFNLVYKKANSPKCRTVVLIDAHLVHKYCNYLIDNHQHLSVSSLLMFFLICFIRRSKMVSVDTKAGEVDETELCSDIRVIKAQNRMT